MYCDGGYYMEFKRICALWLASLFAHLTVAQAWAAPATTEQWQFSAMDRTLKRPVPIPRQVLAEIALDPDIKHLLESEHLSPEKIPSSWFLVSEVHLSTAAEKDLVIVGTGPVLGANVTTFWIFRLRKGRFESLLKPPAAAMSLVINRTRSNGYHDLELFAGTAVMVSRVLCKFDGKSYKATTKTLEP
jgi:hypothetical protein